MTDKPRITVDVWSDVMCPWCALGYTQFAKTVSLLKEEIAIEVRWMPFELNPHLPPEGRSQAQHLADNYGRSLQEVEQMRAQMAETAERVGFSMEYAGEGEAPEAMMWNTFEAHKLARWVLAEAGPEAQTLIEMALFRAHFQQRRNVGDREVLLGIAESEGFDRAKAAEALDDEALALAVRLEEQRGREAGINSVPSFVVNGRYIVQGAREPEDYVNMLRKVAGLIQAA